MLFSSMPALESFYKFNQFIMKKLIFAIVIIVISFSASYAQSLKSISNNQNIQLLLSDKPSSINLKLNFYFHIPESKIIEHGYGFLGEYQLMTSKKFGWLFSANVLSRIIKEKEDSYYTKFGGLVITVCPKLYFNSSNLQGYTSFGGGYRFGGQYSALTLTTALGMEYKLSNAIKLNIETKYNFYLHYTLTRGHSVFINAGIGIIL